MNNSNPIQGNDDSSVDNNPNKVTPASNSESAFSIDLARADNNLIKMANNSGNIDHESGYDFSEDEKPQIGILPNVSGAVGGGIGGITSGGESSKIHGGRGSRKWNKRTIITVDECSGDEEEFAGFDELNGDNDHMHLSKRIKQEPLSDMESFEHNDNVQHTSLTEIKKETELELSDSNLTSAITPSTMPKPEPIKESNKNKGISDPRYRKPFEFGWKRELVYRAHMVTSDHQQRKQSDKAEVYYIAPNGKRLRTKAEISAQITTADGLTLNDFTFTKEPVGMGPEEEIIRSAKPHNPVVRSKPVNFLDLGEPDPSFGFGKRIPKPKMPKGASPPPTTKAKISTTPSAKKNDVILDNELKAGSRVSPKTPKAKPLPAAAHTSSTNLSNATPLTTGEDVTPPLKKRLLSRSVSNVQSPANSPSNLQQVTSTSSKVVPAVNEPIVKGIRYVKGAMSLQPSSVLGVPSSVHTLFASNFFNNVSLGYHVLLHTFQYLKVQELLRASCVCRMWNQAANHSILWRTVRMKNSQVNDWSGLVNALKRNGTKHLDLRKMLIPSNNEQTWNNFSDNIGRVDELESIDLCRIPSKVVEDLLCTNPNLRVLNSVAIKDGNIKLEHLSNLTELTELRLKSLNTLNIDSLTPLQGLVNLKHLSLTSIKDLGTKSIHVIGELNKLETLELAECSEFASNFASDVLNKLHKLERLRLEKGQEKCCTFDILDSIAKLPLLNQLELVNFDIKPEFDVHLKQCKTLKRLLIIPTYVSQSATTNHVVLNGVLKLANYMEHLTWVVTMELLRVTELYVDQCDGKRRNRKQPEDQIPVLKPVPGMSEEDQSDQTTIADVPQVEILPLDKVERILATHMPNTKVSIIKVPYHATWRQNIIDLQ